MKCHYLAHANILPPNETLAWMPNHDHAFMRWQSCMHLAMVHKQLPSIDDAF